MSRASEYANSVSSLYAQIGEARAREASNKGAIWGGTLANIGDFVAQYPQRKAQMEEIKNRAEANQLERERAARLTEKERKEAEADQKLSELFASGQPPTISQIITAVGPERGVRIATGLKALQESAAIVDPRADFEKTQKVMRDVVLGMNALPEGMRAEAYPGIRNHLVQKGVIKPEDAPEAYDSAWWTSTLNYGKESPKEAAESGFTLGQGQKRYDAQGNLIAESPAAAGSSEGGFTLAPGGKRYDAQGKLIASAPERPEGTGSRMWVYRDGKPVRVSESEIRPGDTPAGSREQGRPVTSGDANRLKDYDTGLDDVTTIKNLLKPGTTGAKAAVGAWVPNFITEWTGWGQDAKSTQAVIDRVKQVIGKTLEEGVLRKEDEAKYEKILPTIKDPYPVVATKIAGLERAIQLKKQRQLEALSDADYDVSKFLQRPPTAGGTTPLTAPAPAPKKNPFR